MCWSRLAVINLILTLTMPQYLNNFCTHISTFFRTTTIIIKSAGLWAIDIIYGIKVLQERNFLAIKLYKFRVWTIKLKKPWWVPFGIVLWFINVCYVPHIILTQNQNLENAGILHAKIQQCTWYIFIKWNLLYLKSRVSSFLFFWVFFF